MPSGAEDNTGIMPSGAEDNTTSDTTFLHFKLRFILLSLLKVSLTDQTQVLRLSVWKGATSYVL